MTQAANETAAIVPGTIVVVRDEEWLVTQVQPASDGEFVHVQGLSELVRETEAIFSTALDEITPLDPTRAKVVADDSPNYRRSRLWLESTLRKTAVPLTDPRLSVADRGMADTLDYQMAAVRKALDPTKLRPRILLADAVGLGKTLEIGMILSELVRRGRGERILIVTPRHVLEQMQFEMWTRFALPFVRLDSVGIQRIRQKLPASRNPFAYYRRVIVSIDTLKSDRYLAHLEKQYWDAVVIDESHNVTNSTAQNNRLARLLARRSDALILASATPHNGRKESFAELIRLLEPSAVTPDGELVEDLVKDLIIRRHRHSPEVSAVVGAEWAERMEPNNLLVPASPAEDAIAEELETTWLHPTGGKSPYSGGNAALFPWTLAKAFLSSPEALLETVEKRIASLGKQSTESAQEVEALERLRDLALNACSDQSAKFDALVSYLKEIGVGRGKSTRVVIFAERVKTLHTLQQRLTKAMNLPDDAVVVLHGQLTDERQQEIVESFKQEASPIRILVTGDVASEGVNLHLQCHHLVHYDIPWSLIRIEQRNGRIDRYGQTDRPQITTLLLEPSSQQFSGDLRVLQRLMEKEHEAHKALGDAASLMGKYDVQAEEDAIRKVLAGQRELDDEVRDVDAVGSADAFADFFARIVGESSQRPTEAPVSTDIGIYGNDSEFLRDALHEVFETPHLPAPSGVKWAEYPNDSLAELVPTKDLADRLAVLPQTYLADRRVNQRLVLATRQDRGVDDLQRARADESTSLWPESSYLAPLHPVLDWASDRALAALARNEVFAVRGNSGTHVLLAGTLTNRRGQVVASSIIDAVFPNPDAPSFAVANPLGSAAEALAQMDMQTTNTGPIASPERFEALLAPAIAAARAAMEMLVTPAQEEITARVEGWVQRSRAWQQEASELTNRAPLRERRQDIEQEQQLAAEMLPQQLLVRPLLVVVGEED